MRNAASENRPQSKSAPTTNSLSPFSLHYDGFRYTGQRNSMSSRPVVSSDEVFRMDPRGREKDCTSQRVAMSSDGMCQEVSIVQNVYPTLRISDYDAAETF